ncbi:transcriptional regulator [Mycobacterium montefiorense]|uniref:Transcriptional regulator n=2 Tax=Mycobacterium montefiorense TaxID=154654 RepID=A0AA37PNP8_9MYCO|nr:transcriptional regulator [Mycobacterium montefiorense]GKU34854.1 transcriptional regulator [Mycobacterium montefiorense]GKU40867.1 transcriptional regulator [Mycobacterium montefiorense]GKU46976.1 transcriptional regulator [Mycobacterium montefiorense]GKU49096.1 transcriptional regulator [Mycobacterium montefiorense]
MLRGVIESDSDWSALLAPHLRIAVAVLEEQHITRAAQKLGVPQPTVTAAIRRLAAATGAPLVKQSGRGIVSTAAGQAFLPGAREALAFLRNARLELSEVIDPDRGRVSLGFVTSRGGTDVPILIAAFLAAYPDISFRLQQGSADALLDAMGHGLIDVAILAPIPDGANFGAVALDTERLYLAVGAGHHLADRDHVDLREVESESFVALTEGTGLRQVFDLLCHTAGFVPRLMYEGQEIATLRGLVRAKLGVAVLPPDSHCSEGIVEIPIASPLASREVVAVWIKDRQLSPAAARFIEFLQTSGAQVLSESL